MGLNPPAAATERVLTLPRLADRLPVFTASRTPDHLVANDIYLYVAGTVNPAMITASQGGVDVTFTSAPAVGGLGGLKALVAHDVGAPMGDLVVTIGDRASTVDRLLVVERYTLT
jgi:hypothetical protein